jgi:hypothetical protein
VCEDVLSAMIVPCWAPPAHPPVGPIHAPCCLALRLSAKRSQATKHPCVLLTYTLQFISALQNNTFLLSNMHVFHGSIEVCYHCPIATSASLTLQELLCTLHYCSANRQYLELVSQSDRSADTVRKPDQDMLLHSYSLNVVCRVGP